MEDHSLSLKWPTHDFGGETLRRKDQQYSSRLPLGWEQNVSISDEAWIGRSLFVKKGVLTSSLKLWWYPPSIERSLSRPDPDVYHRQRIFLWMPLRIWQVGFLCIRCNMHQSISSKGIYNRVRLVLDMKDFTSKLKLIAILTFARSSGNGRHSLHQ